MKTETQQTIIELHDGKDLRNLFYSDGDSSGSFSTHMMCPVPGCGDEYVHILSTRKEDNSEQGQVVIEFYCESGHEFELVFNGNQGMVYPNIRLLKTTYRKSIF